jgi:hypothetical protein
MDKFIKPTTCHSRENCKIIEYFFDLAEDVSDAREFTDLLKERSEDLPACDNTEHDTVAFGAAMARIGNHRKKLMMEGTLTPEEVISKMEMYDIRFFEHMQEMRKLHGAEFMREMMDETLQKIKADLRGN